jgi:hypothetical protein
VFPLCNSKFESESMFSNNTIHPTTFQLNSHNFEKGVQKADLISAIRNERVQSLTGQTAAARPLRSLYTEDDFRARPDVNNGETRSSFASASDVQPAKSSSDTEPLYKILKKGQQVYAKYINPQAPVAFGKNREDVKYFPASIQAVMHGGYMSAKYDIIFVGFEAVGTRTVSWQDIRLTAPEEDNNLAPYSGRVVDSSLVMLKEVIHTSSVQSLNESEDARNSQIRERLLMVRNMLESANEEGDDAVVSSVNPMALLESAVTQTTAVPAAPHGRNSASDNLVASILARREQLRREEQDKMFEVESSERDAEAAKHALAQKQAEAKRQKALQQERDRLGLEDGSKLCNDNPRDLNVARMDADTAVLPPPSLGQSLGHLQSSARQLPAVTLPDQQVMQNVTHPPVECGSRAETHSSIVNTALSTANRVRGNWRKRT